MTTLLPHTVTIEHWSRARVTAGDVIERWSIVNDDGRTILTFESEIEAHRRCREDGWVVARTNEGALP